MSFRENLEREPISSLEIREAITLNEHTLLRSAIARMRSRSLGCAVLVNRYDEPTGVFTERSVITALRQAAQLDERPVSDFVDPSFVVVKSNAPILHVWDLIRSASARFVCVTDEHGKLIGLTGQRGISEYLSEYFEPQIAVQRLGCHPWMREREGA